MALRLLGLCGSQRAASLNRALLHAAERAAPVGVVIEIHPGLNALPHFNPDLDGDAPPAEVAAFRDLVGAADGLLIACPEYAHGIPGVFKNALDWLVSSEVFPDKPIALLDASGRATHGPAALREVLTTMSGRIIEAACVTVPLPGKGLTIEAIFDEPWVAAALRPALLAFARALDGADAPP